MGSNLGSALTARLEREKLAIFTTNESPETQNRLWSEHKAKVKAYLANDDAAESAVPRFASSLESGISHVWTSGSLKTWTLGQRCCHPS